MLHNCVICPLIVNRRNVMGRNILRFFNIFISEDNVIVPPGTESSHPESENMADSGTEGKQERTVIPPKRPFNHPKRPYNSGPGQVHRGYINPYHQNNYGPSAPKKPFDFSRVGGKFSMHFHSSFMD